MCALIKLSSTVWYSYICLSFSLLLVASSLETAPPSNNYAIHHGCVNRFQTSWKTFVFFLKWDTTAVSEWKRLFFFSKTVNYKLIFLSYELLKFSFFRCVVCVFYITYTIWYISYGGLSLCSFYVILD